MAPSTGFWPVSCGFRRVRSLFYQPQFVKSMTTECIITSGTKRPSDISINTPMLRVKKLTDLAIVPSRGSVLAAGYDLSSAYDAVIPARGKGLVKTDLAIAIPHGTYARVAPRSGLALKKFIDTGAGVIDEDYRGNVGVILFNHSDEDFPVKRGDRVAQLILEKIEYAVIDVVEDLDETDRGAGGFGSTGVEGPILKQQRTDEVSSDAVATPSFPSSVDDSVLLEGLESLFASGAIDAEKRMQVKKTIFTASDRQFNVLKKALSDYLSNKDEPKALEWINAFLQAKTE